MARGATRSAEHSSDDDELELGFLMNESLRLKLSVKLRILATIKWGRLGF